MLEWYREMGVDQAVEDQPVDWLARGDAPPGGDLQPVRRQPTRAGGTGRPHDAPSARRARAASQHRPHRRGNSRPPHRTRRYIRRVRLRATPPASTSWARRWPRFDGCSLKATAKNLCFYRAPPSRASC